MSLAVLLFHQDHGAGSSNSQNNRGGGSLRGLTGGRVVFLGGGVGRGNGGISWFIRSGGSGGRLVVFRLIGGLLLLINRIGAEIQLDGGRIPSIAENVENGGNHPFHGHGHCGTDNRCLRCLRFCPSG